MLDARRSLIGKGRALALFFLTALLFSCAVTSPVAAQGLPKNSYLYRAILIKEVRHTWGINGNVALFAAQIHQESAWKANAQSHVGARGLGQFMPGTADDMNRWYQRELAGLATHSPLWSIRALVLYDFRLYNAIKPMSSPGVSECDRFAMMLSGYNGGLGWTNRDRRLAASKQRNPDIWFGQVELESNRAPWALSENRGYVRRILFKHLPLYLEHGYPGAMPCSP